MSSAYAPAERSQGRGYLWTGIGLALLGVAMAIGQYAVLKMIFTPWYAPVLATLGVVLLFIALARRRSVTRFVSLAVILALAGLQWYFLIWLARLPIYDGPASVQQKIPPFRTTLADGRSFTEKDLDDGTPTVLTFFRGRW